MFVWLYLPHLCCLNGHHSCEWFCGELCAKTSVMHSRKVSTQNFEHLKTRSDWLSKIFVDIDLPKYVWDDRKDIQNEVRHDSIQKQFSTHQKILDFSMSEDSWGSTPHKFDTWILYQNWIPHFGFPAPKKGDSVSIQPWNRGENKVLLDDHYRVRL